MQQSNKFNFFVPATFDEVDKDFVVKGKTVSKKVKRVKGIASTSSVEDSDGETLFPDGFDYKPFLTKGFLNYDHQQKGRPSAIIGEPDVAKVINGGKDFYIEGFLYPDSEEAQQVAQLAEILEKNSPNRRLGYSIEGQVIERGCGPQYFDEAKTQLNPGYSSALWKKVVKARITGVAITPCPKNPNTLLSLVKGEYNDLLIEDDNEMNPELEKAWGELTIVKGGEGSGRKKTFREVLADEHGKKMVEGIEGLNKDNPDHKVFYDDYKKELKEKHGYDYQDEHWDNFKKAMTAEGASNAGLIKESIEGVVKNNAYLDEDKDHKVGNVIQKSDVYNQIVSNYTTDLVKAKQIFNLIKSVNNKFFKMENITQEAISKAFEFLSKASETGPIDSAKPAEDDMEKAKEMCKGLLASKKSKEEVIDEMTKGGFSLETATTTCDSCVAEMSNLENNGGQVAAVTPTEVTGANQPLAKSEDTDLSKGEGIMDFLQKSFGDTNELMNNKFSAVGKILKQTVDQNELLKGQFDELQEKYDTLAESIKEIGGTAVATKSVRTVGAVEKFAKSESAHSTSTSVFNLKSVEDRNDLLDILDVEIEKSRSAGRTPNALLLQAVSELEIAKSIPAAIVPLLRSMNIAVESK
jgi:hypothetical protein